MVAVIKTSSSLKRPFYYNEEKQKKQKAILLTAENYPFLKEELDEQKRLKYLLKMAALNSTTVVNSVHISLNFAPEERLPNERMKEISKAYMQGIGFGEQPYLVYRHHDAGHEHLHIVTTNIQMDGKRISLHNIGKQRSEPTRKAIEKKYGLVPAEEHEALIHQQKTAPVAIVKYGKTDTKKAIGNVLEHVYHNYRFTSLPELNAVLGLYNIAADRGSEGSAIYENKGLIYRVLDEEKNKVGVPIKASLFHFKPTLRNIESKFVKNDLERQKYKPGTRVAIEKTFTNNTKLSLKTFQESLYRNGVSAVFRANKDGQLYGITFVDHRTKCVFNGSALGKKYSAKAIMERCAGGNDLGLKNPYQQSLGKSGNLNYSLSQPTDKELKQAFAPLVFRVEHILRVITEAKETFEFLPYQWRKKRKKRRIKR